MGAAQEQDTGAVRCGTPCDLQRPDLPAFDRWLGQSELIAMAG